MKKVYFACSIRGGRGDAEWYGELVQIAKKYSKVLTEIFADQKLTPQGMNKPAQEIWETDLGWIREADAIIAEVTNPSLGVGYEIAKAEEWGKPILALYRPSPERKLSAMIAGSPNVTVFEYTDLPAAEHAVAMFMANVRTHQTI